jgi:hypothetical protein
LIEDAIVESSVIALLERGAGCNAPLAGAGRVYPRRGRVGDASAGGVKDAVAADGARASLSAWPRIAPAIIQSQFDCSEFGTL